ncbi:MAG: PAS domain S-box protein [Syntrophobacteraceae bacterium]
MGRKKLEELLTPTRIAIIYLIVGGLWVLLSDGRLSLFVSRGKTLIFLQTFKDWFFIAVTAVVLYLLIRAASQSLMKARSALMESERRYRAIGELIPFGVWVSDPDGTLVYISDSFLDILDLTLDEFNTFGWTSRMRPEQAGRARQDWLDCVAHKSFWDYEFDVRDKNGEYITILSRGVPMQDKAGRTVSWVGLNIDITQRKKMEEALRESERRYSAIGELIPFGVWVSDPDGTLVYISDSFLDIFDTNLEEFNTFTWTSRLRPEQAGRAQRDWLECMEKGCFWDYEFDVLDKNGECITVLSRGVPMRDKTGRTVSWVGLNIDITQRKRMEEALRESEERHRALIEASSDGIFVVDEERMFTSCNQAFMDLFGYTRDEVLGKSARLIHLSDENFHSFGLQAYPTIASGRPFRTEWDFQSKNGLKLPLDISLSAVRAPDGCLTGYVGILRDMTERKKAEEELVRHRNHLEEMVKERTRELEAAQRALVQKEKLKTLGVMSAEVAHEIRNPLVAIGGFARRLTKMLPDSPEVSIILHETERIEAILGRIKNYLRPVDLEPHACVVNTIVSETLEALSDELSEKNIAWQLDLAPELSPAYVDPVILKEILGNLTKNSIKLMDAKRLGIKTWESEKNIHISFRNPVAKEKIGDPELLFLPFEERVQGIGLPLSYRLLREMGGLLTYSEEGSDVIFTVSLLKGLHPETEISGLAE